MSLRDAIRKVEEALKEGEDWETGALKLYELGEILFEGNETPTSDESMRLGRIMKEISEGVQNLYHEMYLLKRTMMAAGVEDAAGGPVAHAHTVGKSGRCIYCDENLEVKE